MSERFSVTYRIIATNSSEAKARANAIALEQTVEIPRDIVPLGYIADEIMGRVEEVTSLGPKTYSARVSYSLNTVGCDLPQLLNVIFGNSSMQKGLKVTNLTLTSEMTASFPGASFGVSGIRNATRRERGGLIAPVIKPMGLSSRDLALIAQRVVLAGADIVKEDHGLSNQPSAPFYERVSRISETVATANACRQAKGDFSRALYFPNIGGSIRNLVEYAFYAKNVGADGVIIIPGLIGFDAINTLAQDKHFSLPIMAHPSFLGSHVIDTDMGFTHAMMFGTIMRLAGADISVFPNFGGRFGFSQDQCTSIVSACRSSAGPGKPIMPSPGGGMSIDRIPELHQLYNDDCVYLLGGELLRYGERIDQGISAVREALNY
ncbi:MAG: ribulose 1,5-bisphosphate carboxylase [Hyphomicrobiaceae bacterium]|nr:ribulose 1,5-bisphosphate carboxylase [Hyphomicrobiaceae bacterium]